MQIVTAVIPCYQEREFIRSCLVSVLAFELPPAITLEVLVLDGMSTDGTRAIVSSMAEDDGRVRLVDNPGRIQSSAMNRGIAEAKGEYIVRLDAHATYPRDYLRLCLETAERTGADNVGGVVRTLQRGDSYQAAVTQALTTHRFGVGNSGFRVGTPEGEADTVPYGCFRRDVFDRVGLFDERLVRAQDYEMNRRIRHYGGRVWLNPAVVLDYYQQSTLANFYRKQFVYEAPYNAYLWYVAPYAFAPRHAVTAVFAAGVVGGMVLAPVSTIIRVIFALVLGLYFMLSVLSAIQQAVRYRRFWHVVVLPPCFFLYHFGHGAGVWCGALRLLTGRAPVQVRRAPSGSGERNSPDEPRPLGA